MRRTGDATNRPADDRASSRTSRAFAVFLPFLLVLVVTGCGDPVDVRIENDTLRPVLIAGCEKESCAEEIDPADVSVTGTGESFKTPVSTSGVPYVFVVLDPSSGRRIGCLPVVLTHRRDGVVVRVSERVACRRSYARDVEWPPARR
jgi:hypothetical protein